MILIAALGLRIAYVQHTPYRPVNDAGTYNRLASEIARTGDYDTGSGPGAAAGGARGPTAYFPPAFPYALAIADLLDGHASGHRPAVPGERIEQAVVGTLAVGLVGLVALELFGMPTALVAMGLAAIYPVLIETSGTLVAENLLLVLELSAVWMALRGARSGHPLRWAAATGLVLGLATLTHENAILLWLPLAFAIAPVARVRGVVTLTLACALMIAPWTIRNAVVMHRFIPVSDETGITVRGTYNPSSAAATAIPFKWRYFWKIPADSDLRSTAGRYTEPELSSRLGVRAVRYVEHHPTAPLSAGWHNLLRMAELEGPAAWHASAWAMGLDVDVARTGVAAFWLLAALALAGVGTRQARAAPRWVWAMPLLLLLSTVFVNAETPRFREPIDPFLVLLAACAVSAALARMTGRERRSGLGGAPVGGRRRTAQLARGQAQRIEMVERLAGADGHAGQR